MIPVLSGRVHLLKMTIWVFVIDKLSLTSSLPLFGCLGRGTRVVKGSLKVQQTLFSQELDVVFYDVTTLYFESQKQQEGEFASKRI